MEYVVLFYAQIISLLIETILSQYQYQDVQNAYYQIPYQNMYQNGYPMDNLNTQDEYENPRSYQRSIKHRHKSYGNSGGRLPLEEEYSYEESEECKCSCNRCADPEPCCRNACNDCNTQNQQNLIIVPYPYPFIVTPKVVITETPITSMTKKPSQLLQQIVTDNNIPIQSPPSKTDTLRHRSNYMLTSLRRTKPVWLPKYGIVPIPDRLAEKLMSKLREVKGLKAERRKRMIKT